MLTILVVVALINTTWQLIRAWLPKFLQTGRGMEEGHMLLVNIGFYIVSDIGCLGAGVLTLWLQRRGASVHGARSRAFLAAALLCALAVVAAAFLPLGWPLLLAVLLAGAGALGVFPIYYSLTQDISARHQGKVTGIGSVAAWAFSSPAQKYYGRLVDQTKSYDLGLAIAGCLPLAAFVILRLLWGESAPAPGGEAAGP
jgi:MFS family permease